jgi:signal transduction histidine kinase
LSAARLGVELGLRSGGLSPVRLRAIELELDRATLALGELGGARAAAVHGHVDLRALVADSVEAWRPAADTAGVDLRMSWTAAEAAVVGDRLRLAQATGNLIANAIEHGGGPVEVRGRLEGSSVRIEVIDGGAGLVAPLDELARRARRRAWLGGDRTRGHGLAVAAAVAAAHGGRLAAAPCDRGARLVLELPVAAERVSVPADP